MLLSSYQKKLSELKKEFEEICHFSKILLQTAKESDKPLELVGRDLNLAMKMWLEEEGQKHEDNA